MTQEKRPVGRPTKYKQEYCDMVIEHMSEGASLTSFAASIDVSRSTIDNWMSENPEFLEAVKIAKAKCGQWWEQLGRSNAITGQGNATLVIFGLKNMAPDEWREKQEIVQTGTMTHKVKLEELTDEELAKIISDG